MTHSFSRPSVWLAFTALSLFSSGSAWGQVFWQEDFEKTQDWDYVVSNRFYFNGKNYFQEVTVDQLVEDFAPYTAFTGVQFFGAATTSGNGGNGLPEKTILFNPIDTSGKGELTFYGDFASSTDPSKQRFENNDGAILFFSTDEGATWNSSLSFVSDRSKKNTNGHLVFQDPNFSGLTTSLTDSRSTIESIGAGSGQSLTNQFTTFSFLIPEADEVWLKLLVSVDGSKEEIAFDNFRIEGAIPEPATYITIMGGLGLLYVFWKRRYP